MGDPKVPFKFLMDNLGLSLFPRQYFGSGRQGTFGVS